MTRLSRSALFPLACAAACSFGACLPAHAAILKENFDAAFPAWESRWFARVSDASNYCTTNWCLVDGIPTEPSNTVRGIAGSGLCLSSVGGWSSFPITITFIPEFAATIEAMKIDVADYVDATFSAWDVNGNLVYTKQLRVDDYRDIPTSHYQTLRFRSAAGVSHFTISGPSNGNTVVDNIVVKTSTP